MITNGLIYLGKILWNDFYLFEGGRSIYNQMVLQIQIDRINMFIDIKKTNILKNRKIFPNKLILFSILPVTFFIVNNLDSL